MLLHSAVEISGAADVVTSVATFEDVDESHLGTLTQSVWAGALRDALWMGARCGGLDRLDPLGLDRLDPLGLDRLDPLGRLVHRPGEFLARPRTDGVGYR